MELGEREKAVLAKLQSGAWRTPAQLVDDLLVYQQVNAVLKRLAELGLAERQHIGGLVRRRFRYRITEAGKYLDQAAGEC